jgi:hypothetical protein
VGFEIPKAQSARSFMLFEKFLRLGGLVALTATLVAAAAGPVRAAELRYQPINPHFGGNALNNNSLLNSAQAQNQQGGGSGSGSGSNGSGADSSLAFPNLTFPQTTGTSIQIQLPNISR